MGFQPETGLATLTVKQIYADDIGVFTCVAENKFGKSQSKSNLKVNSESIE